MLTEAVKIVFDSRYPDKIQYELVKTEMDMLTPANEFSADELEGAIDYFIDHTDNDELRAKFIKAKEKLPEYLALKKAGKV
ncbi:hypothetical protein [Selenomonas sp. FC4001]|uniref:hypothetical protein n=1 Tax=Selenomonas sp. FC4001 TaxID=1408313 RepID=UPI00056D256B|nr:hypothetical protein [Selenomonas sp. FC4001]